MSTKKDITIRKNSDFRLEAQWLAEGGAPKDLTGCQFKMQIRDKEGGETLYGTWTNGYGFSLQPVNGIFTLEIAQSEMTTWSFKQAVYDIVVTWPSTKKDPVMNGQVILERGVTL